MPAPSSIGSAEFDLTIGQVQSIIEFEATSGHLFLLPMLRNSDRQLHDIAQWEWIEDEMHVRYPNGWQLREVERIENTVKGKVGGRWFDKEEQKRVPDDSVEFVVAVPPDQMSALFTLFDEICARFDQKCLYFTTGGDAALYYPTKERNRETDPERA